MKAKDKINQPLDVVYPWAFLEINRANAKVLANMDNIHIQYSWIPNPEPPSNEQSTTMKNRIDWELRKVMLVYGTNSFVCTIKIFYPNVDTRTTTFSELRDFAVKSFKNWKHNLLYNGFYVSLKMKHIYQWNLLTRFSPVSCSGLLA
jgi:hypothetical protein